MNSSVMLIPISRFTKHLRTMRVRAGELLGPHMAMHVLLQSELCAETVWTVLANKNLEHLGVWIFSYHMSGAIKFDEVRFRLWNMCDTPFSLERFAFFKSFRIKGFPLLPSLRVPNRFGRVSRSKLNIGSWLFFSYRSLLIAANVLVFLFSLHKPLRGQANRVLRFNFFLKLG